MMGAISLKIDEAMLKRMDDSLRENDYSTRTEFVRDAIRDKLTALERERFAKEFLERFHGKAKNKVSDAELRRAREIAVREIMTRDV